MGGEGCFILPLLAVSGHGGFSFFLFPILETETSFRFLFWKSIVFQILETETTFHFLFWNDLGNGNQFPFPIILM